MKWRTGHHQDVRSDGSAAAQLHAALVEARHLIHQVLHLVLRTAAAQSTSCGAHLPARLTPA